MITQIEKIKQLQQQIKDCEVEIREHIYRIIREVAEKHKRPKISKHMFVVKFSEMVGNVWDASFYDYERASEVLKQKLDNVKSIDLLNTIETLYNNRLKNGTCIVRFKTKVPFDNVKNWSFVIEHAYPLKTEFVKEILDKLNNEP